MFSDRVSLCRSDSAGTYSVDQAGLCLWSVRCVPSLPGLEVFSYVTMPFRCYKMMMWTASVSTFSVFGTEGVRYDENLHKDQTTAVVSRCC